jgi:hypothetical protein
MTKSVLAFFLLGGSLLGLSFALQAQDLPETPYDESQDLACEQLPLCVIQVLQDSFQRTESTPKSTFPLLSGSAIGRDKTRVEKREVPEQPNFVTASIRAVPLRC